MTRTQGTATFVDACALLSTVAGLLADGGPDALPAVLTSVVDELGLRSAVLRSAGSDGDLLAVAGEVVHAVPSRRDGGAPDASVVEIPVRGDGRQLAALTVVGATATHLPVLRACTAVVGVALSRPDRVRDDLALTLLAAADADADAAADDLHDGPVQELVFARFAADAAARGGDPLSARDAVQGALQSLRRALWLLRPRGAGDGGLPAALTQLSDRLAEAGRPRLDLTVDEDACAALSGAASSTCYRFVQSVATAGLDGTAVRVGRRGSTVRLEVDGTVPSAVPDRWAARARALDAQLALDPAGRLVLSVPVGASDPTPDPEAIS